MSGCTRVLVLLSFAWLMTAAACDRPLTSGQDAPGADRSRAAHAIDSRELRAVMYRLGSQVRRNWPQEIAEEKAAAARRDRQARFREAVELAQVLADSARGLPETVADVELSEADRALFAQQASQLASQAEALGDTAKEQNYEAMQAMLSRIKTTCNDCHEQFAALAGPISFGGGQ